MYKDLLTNDYITVQHLPERQLLVETYLPAADELEKTEIKYYARRFVEFLRENDIKRVLSDHRQRSYIYPPESQQWIVENILAEFARLGVERFAMIRPEDFVADLSGQQTLDDARVTIPSTPLIQSFTSYEEAFGWVCADSESL